jgi:hypothetical protein
MARSAPKIIVETQAGDQRIRIRYLAGDEAAAFDLARRALPALQELARATRSGECGSAPEPRGL